MPTVINPALHYDYDHAKEKSSLLKRFLAWSENQQENRFLWIGIALAGHGCALTPVTLYFVVLAGVNFTLFMLALAAMAMAVVVNLAALPTKVTVPVLLLSALIDVAVIITALATMSW